MFCCPAKLLVFWVVSNHIDDVYIFFLPPLIISLSIGVAKLPKIGAANTAKRKNPPLCRLFFLPPMYQTPRLTDSFLIPKNHPLPEIASMLYDIMSVRLVLIRIHFLL